MKDWSVRVLHPVHSSDSSPGVSPLHPSEVTLERRELFRRTFLGGLGAAVASLLPRNTAARPHSLKVFPPDHDASKELARSDWKPVFLDEHQNATLIALSDLILPATDTAGAKDALVNRFIDRLLAAETRETQRAFLDSLAYLDGECMQRYRSAFVYLPSERQVEFLKFIAYPHSLVSWGENRSGFTGHDRFRELKGWITRAYYNSEMGLRELGWDGSAVHGEFEGCQHPPRSHK